jgi:hypoxanthine phosphoribosyltransferase
VAGRQVVIIDDVFDTGLSLSEAIAHLHAVEAAEVLTAVFARKPWPAPRPVAPDFVAWEAPAAFLVGYGMDLGGAYRGLPYIASVIEPASQGAGGSRESIAS